MNKLIFLIGPILVIVLGLGWYFSERDFPKQGPTGDFVTVNGHVINVDIADEPGEQTQGLSDRQNLAEDAGMLFIFPQKGVRKFWMKNMHFPLDIIWIDGNTVVSISRGLPPEGVHPLHTYDSGAPVDRVLEINAGMADELDLKIGDKIEIEF